jgi:predicted alpha/beta superfamily hydrolase
MARFILTAFLLVSASLQANDVVIGQAHTLQSDILGETRTVKVWLPDDYAGSGKSYPVFYLLDAEMAMRFAKAAATVAEFGGSRAPEMIVVGVENTDRRRDMFPERGGAGGADNFLAFLTGELLPFVDDAFRGNGYRILTGHSNSALFATYALLTQPDSFNAYFAISPMLGHREPEMMALAGQSFDDFPRRHTFLYIAYGEHDYGQVVDVVPEFLEALDETKPASLDYRVEMLPGEGHVPYPSYGDALLALFPDFMLRDEDLTVGLAAIDEHYQSLSRRYGFTIETPAEALIGYGDMMRSQREYTKAIAAYGLAAQRFPGYAPVYYLMGRSYEGAGNTAGAIAAYRKFLMMRPGVESVEARIAELEETAQGSQ